MTREEKTYIFYFETGFANCTVKEEYTESEIGIDENTTEDQKNILLKEMWEDFFSNYDHGWFEKKK